MSRRNKLFPKGNEDFVKRFIEVCGTSKPGDIAGLLEISYQTVLNYLSGRLPESGILIKISEKTNYSLNWLLTGKGGKFVDKVPIEDSENLLKNMLETLSPEMLENLNHFFDNYELKKKHTSSSSRKVVKISSNKIREEKENSRKTTNLLESKTEH